MEKILLLCLSNLKCFWSLKFHFILLLCMLLSLVVGGSCAMKNGVQDLWGQDVCRSSVVDSAASTSSLIGSTTPGILRHSSLNYICSSPRSFCFPSTLHGFVNKEDPSDSVSSKQSDLHYIRENNLSWSPTQATYVLLDGRSISCSLSIERENNGQFARTTNSNLDLLTVCRGTSHDNSEMVDLADLGGSSAHVSINPPLLDWGPSNLYVPSLALLTVSNRCNDSILHVYEPSSTDPQFYTYNFNEISLGPGESASIPFVFLPKLVGLSSAHLILQTSSGGFVVRARGLAIETPYEKEPPIGLTVSFERRMKKNLSLYNHFDDVVNVVEFQAWMGISDEKVFHLVQAVCRVVASHGPGDDGSSPYLDEWLTVKSDQLGMPLMRMRPFRKWEVAPNESQPILEVDIFPQMTGNIFGAFCMHVQSSISQEWSDTVIVPLEADMHGKVTYSSLSGSLSVLLESRSTCNSEKPTVFALSLRNDASYLLRLVEVGEVTDGMEVLEVKYIEGLLLFPGTRTHIATITYYPAGGLQDPTMEIPKISSSCKLLILTNDSYNSQIEISCERLQAESCLREYSGLCANPYTDRHYKEEKETSSNSISGSILNTSQTSAAMKVLAAAREDELVLRNWRSQGTISGKSVLDDREVLFPIVQIGTTFSKWITVKNPSQYPVMMQLILNSGAVVDECKDSGKLLDHFLLGDLISNYSMNYNAGFSLSEPGTLDAYVHPYGEALFGPIVFRPSKRCVWRSSALIRNNLSGVEWLHLHGTGGALSLVLLEGSEPVRNVEFNLNVPVPLNSSPPQLFFHTEITGAACSQPLLKELLAQNTGDLPLEIKRIEVSGVDCSCDGFMVHTCRAFALAPGESRRLLISYQTDFSASVVHRNLELRMSNGVLVIPMKATFPLKVLNLCRKSFLLMLLKKIFIVVMVAAFVTLSMFCCIHPQFLNSDCQSVFCKSDKNYVASIRSIGKPAGVDRNQRNSRSVKEIHDQGMGFRSKYADPLHRSQELEATHQNFKQKQETESKIFSYSEDSKTGILSPPSSKVQPKAMMESYGLSEVHHASNLTVKTGRERGRRRKRRGAGGSGLAGKFEVSSSQSGNSTPSSPLSPVMSFTTKRTPLSPDFDQRSGHSCEHSSPRAYEARYKDLLVEAALNTKTESQSSMACRDDNRSPPAVNSPALQRPVGRPCLLPSATFPRTGRSEPGAQFLASTSPIARHARAPGTRACKDAGIAKQGKDGGQEEFTYDIWGNHFSEFHLLGKSTAVPTYMSDAVEDESKSFFARGPQSLINKVPKRSVSPVPNLPIYDANGLNQMSN
ncbi:hypothetical protein H6P81_010944 [Aristolochia fimbriata]|uniref:Transmembrane protein 131-like N-terminal domain-containing protein n=1 Tax=Aristolochia fimbriata TaxID=158543 RepID=A0AAV7EQV0_ARIFI|nr:hypothetical protein H6P81_010944 [Aristolochia fimbriata]